MHADETLDLSPARLPIRMEPGDTLMFRLVLKIKSTGVPINLIGSTINVYIYDGEGGSLVDTLQTGNGIATSNLAEGEVKVFWQSAGKLFANREYPYKLSITFTNGRIRTYLENVIEMT